MRSVTMASAASVAVGSSLTVRESLARVRSPRASARLAGTPTLSREKQGADFRGPGGLGDVGVLLEVHVRRRDRVRMAPARQMVARHAEEAAQSQLLSHW